MLLQVFRIVVVVAAVNAACVLAADPTPVELQQSTRINALASELLRVSLGDDALSNAMVSPVSLFYALSVLEAGAGDDSRSLLRRFLLGRSSDEAPVLQAVAVPLADALVHEADSGSTVGRFVMSNSLWSTDGATSSRPYIFAQDFIDTVGEAFDADVYSVDFMAPGVSQRVNEWAQDRTFGLIREIIDDGTMRSLTWLILNAAYFEGSWATAMRRLPAGDDFRFVTATGDELALETVATRQPMRLIDHDDGAVTLSIPFSGRRYHLLIHLAPGETTDIADWLHRIAIPRLGDATQAVFAQGRAYQVDLRMPVFSYSRRLTLRADTPATQELGLLPLFTGEANFLTMVDRERSHPAVHDTRVGLIQQDTRIELDEKGVKAAAVTMVGGIVKSTVAPRYPQRRIVVDRPFAWSIVEGSSRSILFSGVFAQP
ncbi:MAG: serpin family protein [Halieaceae bacterium]|jgi:serpin B|nr:serpin family protein [Halieaceae bacterium]